MLSSRQSGPPLFGRLVVIGLGLIGGSFAKGLRERGLFFEVVGVDLDAQSCQLAVQQGVVDRCESDLAKACQGADVIQLAVPILAMEKLLGQLAQLDLGDAVLTDVGSAKGSVVRAARRVLEGRLARLGQKVVGVKALALQGHEQIARLQAAAIGVYALHRCAALAHQAGAGLACLDPVQRLLQLHHHAGAFPARVARAWRACAMSENGRRWPCTSW